MMTNGSDSAGVRALETIVGSNPIIGLAAGAVVGGVMAGVFVYRKYEEKLEKERLDLIATINRFHDLHLTNITVVETGERISLPAIFKYENGELQFLDITLEQVRALAKTALRAPDDVNLNMYRECVLDAINKLKVYEFIHSKQNGITVTVLEYLMSMIEKYCLSFKGDAVGIAYLQAFKKFIIDFASIQGVVDSQHFTCLTKVHAYLSDALQELVKHQKQRTLDEEIRALLGTCRDSGAQLLRGLVKVTTPIEEWVFVDCASLKELAQGLIRSQYSKRWWKFTRTVPAIDMSKSRIREWVSLESRYHLQSIDPSVGVINIPELSGMNYFKSALSHHELNDFREIFKQCKNFMTQTIKNGAFVPIDDDADINARITLCGEWAKLIDLLNSYQLLLTQESKMLKVTGTFDVELPKHYMELYTMHDFLCNALNAHIQIVQAGFLAIQKSEGFAMHLAPEMEFSDSMMMVLDVVGNTIHKYIQNVKERREKLNLTGKDDAVRAKHEMVERVEWLNQRYHFSEQARQRRSADIQPLAMIAENSSIKQPLSQPQLRRHYPTTYGSFFKPKAVDSQHLKCSPAYRAVIGVRDLLNDYTKNDSVFLRILSGHWNRHYTREVSLIVKKIDKDLAGQAQNSIEKLNGYMEDLMFLKQKVIHNKNGSLAKRIDFIEVQYRNM